MRRRRGFTLIELLVVVAIIALLIAILLPSLGQAKMRANTAKCAVNTRSLANAVNMYITDWKQMFPFSDNQPQSWTQLLYNGGAAEGAGGAINSNTMGGYGALEKIRFCPEATEYSTTTGPMGTWFGSAHKAWANAPLGGGTAGAPFGSSYGLNGWVYNPAGSDSLLGALNGNAPQSMFYRLARGDSAPSETPVFADANWRHVFAKASDGFPAGKTLEDPGPVDVGNHPICRMVMNRHNMQENVAFFDNHAETVSLKKLYAIKWNAIWDAPAPPALPAQ